jgi:endonuclease/exonuclease/phosphatase family metal-dependent hydrolase
VITGKRASGRPSAFGGFGPHRCLLARRHPKVGGVAELRIATFNLLHGLSLADGVADPALLREAAKTLDADVLGLQEVDRRQPRSGGVDQTELVAEALEASWWRFVPAVHGTPGPAVSWTPASEDDGLVTTGPTYGIGLVSRYPVREWRVRRFEAAPVGLPLLVPGRRGLTRVPDEPRLALAALVDGPAGQLTVVNTHLSFVPGWNVGQLRRIVRWVADLPTPRLVIGDFNLPGTLPRTVTRLNQLARVPTYPAYAPRVQFDHVLGDGIGEGQVRATNALRMPISDHCALSVDLEFVRCM